MLAEQSSDVGYQRTFIFDSGIPKILINKRKDTLNPWWQKGKLIYIVWKAF